ncbi:MAG: hypothetical protein WA989_00325 [Henriciella sp.]|uniref:PIN-like domain-containing protein n=1 Tax=Henriciella sp. TaxID=1968823 RepID=UPI003C77BB70
MNRFNVFFDHNCPPAMARMMAGFLSSERPQPRSVALSEVMDRRATDIEWINWVREQPGDWIVATENYRILRVPDERRAFMGAGLRMLVMPKSVLSLPHEKRCALLLWQWPRITRTMSEFDPPLAFEMSPKREGKLRQIGL